MTGQSRFCPSCGTLVVAIGQPFCGACGFNLGPAPTGTDAEASAAESTAKSVPSATASAVGVAHPAAVPGPAVETKKSGFTILGASPALIVTFIAVIAVIVVGAYLMTAPAKSSQGSIEFNPSSFSCDLTLLAPFQSTITLPASVGIDDYVTIQVDDGTESQHVGLFFLRQPDGSWRQLDDTRVDWCAKAGYAMGPHQVRVLNSGGAVLAQGTYSITP